jgi:Tfp pilus assembly protein PilX
MEVLIIVIVVVVVLALLGLAMAAQQRQWPRRRTRQLTWPARLTITPPRQPS